MTYSIIEKTEQKRHSGHRVPGATYIVSTETVSLCGKLPIELNVCPCCNAGIKPTRGYQWVGQEIIKGTCKTPIDDCANCFALNAYDGRYGLMWVGEKYYSTPDLFIRESSHFGVSKRLGNFIPKGLVVGQTVVLLAHRKCVPIYDLDKALVEAIERKDAILMDEINDAISNNEKVAFRRGIFGAFIPTAIEYVITGRESDKKLERLHKQGITLVKVTNGEIKNEKLF